MNRNVILVSLDCSSAFDTIDQDILLKKLDHQFFIKSKALNYIKSYLKNRTFSVDVNNVVSNLHNINYGVPQSSLLGPMFFILFIL